MTAITDDGLLSSLWRASVQGALGFLFVWLVCRMLSRRLSADTHCWLWRLSYVKCLAGLVWGGAILLPLLSPAPRPVSAAAPQIVSAPHQMRLAQTPVLRAVGVPAAVKPKAAPPWHWRIALAAAYVLGLLICLGRLLLAARRTRHILRSALPIQSGREAAALERLAQALGRRSVPALARSAAVGSPVLIAGTILLPAGCGYEEAELGMILAHELAHVRRRDLLWEWLGTTVQTLFFFHPGVVLARREERLAREAAADALALKITSAPAADYGRLLLSLALAQIEPRSPLLGTVGVVEGGTPLRRRLLALRDPGTRRYSRRIALVLVPLTALVFVPWQMTRGQAPAPAIVSVNPGTPTMPAGNKTLSGAVLNEEKKPVAGLAVGLTWHWSRTLAGEMQSGSMPVAHAVTDAQGRFAFSDLPAGSFEYEVWSQANQYVNIHTPLVISKDDTQVNLHIVVSTGSLVTGRVVDGLTGKPMPGIFVGAGAIPPGGDLAKWDFWEMPSEATTDAQGHYQVRVMPGDTFVGIGRITDNTFLTRRVRYSAQRVTAAAGQTANAPDIPMFLRPIIICVGPNGQPVANTPFRIIPEDLAKGGYTLEDHTDETGSVVLAQDPKFENGIFSIHDNEQTASGTYHSTPEGALTITMDGQTTSYPTGSATVHLSAGSAGFIVGVVASEDGRPILGARVNIMETDPKSHSMLENHLFKSNALGAFHAPVDPNGEYHVYVRADGFNQVAVTGDQNLTVAKGATVNLGGIHLTRADGFVAGRVIDSAGKPMEGVLVYVRGGQTFLSGTVTDAQGHFHVPNVVVGDVMHLKLCLHGQSPDSGEALSQSNDEMDLPDVTAGTTEREIVWHPHS